MRDGGKRPSMQFSNAILLFAAFCAPAAGYAAQSAAGGAPVAPSNQVAGATAVAAPETSAKTVQTGGPVPSILLQPGLDGIQRALGTLNQEKWKKGTVRDEAETNIQAIQRDLTSTLPPLLKAADTGPGAMSKMLPVSRNIDALYDVLLRVVDGARISAPGDQVGQLQAALTGLEKARLALNDHLQEMAATGEKQVSDLQVALKRQPVPVCPVVAAPAAPVPATPAVKKKAVKKKPKPATTQPVGTQPSVAQPSGAQPAKPQQ